MGQKTHPVGFRLGVIRGWSSKWYSEKDFAKWLHEDLRLKKFVKKKLGHAGVSAVEVERAANKVKINIFTARPGIVIGKRGAGVETLKKDVQALTSNEVFLNIQEVRKAETNAQLVAENVATQLERRVAFRRAMKKAVQTAMKFGAKGIRLACSGPPRRRGDGALRVVPRGSRAAAHPARRHRVRHHRGAHHLRRHRREVLDLQGRGSCPNGTAAWLEASTDVLNMLAPKKVKWRKQQKGKMRGVSKGATEVDFGEFGLQALTLRLRHLPPDRGGPYRHHPPHQARRQALHPDLPRQAADQEAGRDPHG